jgi:transcriptional regulator with XRE-family HTH domain
MLLYCALHVLKDILKVRIMSSMIVNIKTLMQEQRWSAKELAERSGQKASDIYNILSGKSKKPSADKIEGIARAFGVTTGKILYGEQDKPQAIVRDGEWDGLLYSEAMTLVRHICNAHGIEFANREDERTKLMRFASRIYNYARKRNTIHPDSVFAEDIILSELV